MHPGTQKKSFAAFNIDPCRAFYSLEMLSVHWSISNNTSRGGISKQKVFQLHSLAIGIDLEMEQNFMSFVSQLYLFYYPCTSSFSAWRKISLMRAADWDITFFVMLFRCLVLFSQEIPHSTWTVHVVGFKGRFSIWYFSWSCREDRNTSEVQFRISRCLIKHNRKHQCEKSM